MAKIADIGIISLCFKDFNPDTPFNQVNSLEDQPMLLLFNELCSAFFEINPSQRINKGYEKQPIEKFGTVLKNLIARLYDNKSMKSKTIDDLILEHKNSIGLPDKSSYKWHSTNQQWVDWDNNDPKYIIKAIITLIYRSLFKFVISLGE